MYEDARGRKFYKTIDGNFSNHTVAFCTYYGRSLTQKQIKLHKCIRRGCKRFLRTDTTDLVLTDEILKQERESIKQNIKDKKNEINTALDSRDWKRLLKIK